MTEKRTGKSSQEDEMRPHPSPDSKGSDADKQQEPGAGGLSKDEYDEATEKAVKDVHG